MIDNSNKVKEVYLEAFAYHNISIRLKSDWKFNQNSPSLLARTHLSAIVERLNKQPIMRIEKKKKEKLKNLLRSRCDASNFGRGQ